MLPPSGYHIVEELPARGGTARYRGLRAADGVAVTLLAAAAGSEDAARLAREYAAASGLNLRSIALPLALESHDGQDILIRAECGGLPLDELIPPGGVPLSVALRTAAAIARALDELHNRQRLHLGLNPGSILVDSSTQVYLTDFGWAAVTPLDDNTPPAIPAHPAYMAPEQTGRTGGAIGPATDLYSLGILLFQLLTGELPFRVRDPVEWTHCHIARVPAIPSQFKEGLPEAVDDIVRKLLAKSPEERYHSAAGLAWDLLDCAERVESGEDWRSFQPGARDTSPELAIPPRLYGRAQESTALTAAWRRAAAGRGEMALVTGAAGLGKTALVEALQPEVMRSGGHFIAGKVDERNRATPYSSLTQALQSLLQQVLAEPDARLVHWRDKLNAALGANGQVIVDTLPQAAPLLGPQPPLPELPPAETRIRFQRTLYDFICAFAERKRPLAIFLDDLQWADSASLEFLSYLLSERETRHLLLIGACRDNEIDAAHPLNAALRHLTEAKVPATALALTPLENGDMAQWVADTLGRRDAAELAGLIGAKTGGNPLFARQFLLNLHDEGLLVFDPAQGGWNWDIARIGAAQLGADVAELMAQRLKRLSPPAQRALRIAACIGNRFSARIITTVARNNETKTAAALAETCREGLTIAEPGSGLFRFSHDRIQQAAYAALSPTGRATLHITIGRALLAAHPQEPDALFEIANQFRHGLHLIRSAEERQRLVNLYAQAGNRAKAAAAYEAARSYLATGAKLAGGDMWRASPELAIPLFTGLAECEFICGHTSVAEALFRRVLKHARETAVIVHVYVLRMHLYMSRGDSLLAVQAGREGLRRLGADLPEHPGKGALLAELARIAVGFRGRRIEDLARLPAMTDPRQQSIMRLYMNISVAAYFIDRDLLALAAMRMVSLSLRHGNTGLSAFAYTTLGMVIGGVFGRYRQGFRLGELGCRLGEASGDLRSRGLALSMSGIFTGAWGQPLEKSLSQLRRASRDLLDCGNLMMANYAAIATVFALDSKGEPLPSLAAEAQRQSEFVRKTGFQESAHYFLSAQRKALCLQGDTEALDSFTGPGYDEERQLTVLRAMKERTALAWHLVNRLQTAYLAGNLPLAKAMTDELDALGPVSIAQMYLPRQFFYAALTRLALAARQPAAARQRHLQAAARHSHRLHALAESCPANYRHLDLLVAAERTGVTGGRLAPPLYDKAIRAAARHPHDWALANERMAACFVRLGIKNAASQYLRDACQGYRQWGASALAAALEQRYPAVVLQGAAPPPPEASPVDMAAVVEASQALSGEIEFSSLLHRLMETLASHAGAARVVFILKHDSGLYIEKEWRAGDETPPASAPLPIGLSHDIAHSVVQYAARTLSDVVIDDAVHDPAFAADAYLTGSSQRSVLCLPIIRHGELQGLIYMENPLLRGAFHRGRLRVLHLLAAQLAISLENVALISGLKKTETALRESQDNLARAQDIAHVGNWEWLMEENRTFWSDEVFRIFGLPVPDNEDGRWTRSGYERFIGAVHPEDRDMVARTLKGVTEEEESYSMEFRIVRPDGGIRAVNEIGELQRDSHGQPYRIIGILQDITERKQMEALHTRHQREMEHAARLNIIGEMASGLAHELSQPLSATQNYLRGCIRRLQAQNLDPATLLDVLRLASTQTERAADIINHIKEFVRKREPVRSLLDVRQVTREVLILLERELRKHQVTVDILFPEDSDCLALADKVGLEQVMVNIIKNAIEAMQTAEERRIGILLEQSGGMLRVDITDSGPGITQTQLEEIFQPFFTTKQEGMGLGLSISHGIIESLGGRLWADSTPGGGTTFRFTLPAGAPPSQGSAE